MAQLSSKRHPWKPWIDFSEQRLCVALSFPIACAGFISNDKKHYVLRLKLWDSPLGVFQGIFNVALDFVPQREREQFSDKSA